MGNQPSSPSKSPEAPQKDASACPVDHSTREAYLSAASSSSSSKSSLQNSKPPIITEIYGYPTDKVPLTPQSSPLNESRVVSSIPRASASPNTATPNPNSPPAPASSNSQTPPTSPDQSSPNNWVYPSERMFFDAMRRKSFSPSAPDMATIVPIHNAVNERAWSEILAWEHSTPRLAAENKPCGGPKLRSFSGDSGKLSPKARWRTWIGYERPFDRHDWVVERCVPDDGSGGGARQKQVLLQGPASAGYKGVQPQVVEYVIDFYRGKGAGDQKVSFYLDVRPKLNTLEGWRMRFERLLAWR